MKRLEYKYLVPKTLLPVLRSMILPYVEIDEYVSKTGKNNYTVRSIYFDTKNFNLYQEKLTGIKLRKKVRIRSYNQETPSSPLFL
ncbi:MAG: VTC domain-containing protein, partial [Calditrichia bacterium]|nr:VTC domain-containing protein [Calditrichia bacterium]